jgi:hypothetical protein
MNITTIALLLQITSSLLSGAHNNAAMSATTTAQVVALGNRTVQIAAQAIAPVNFAVPANNSIWPNVNDLLAAPYLDAHGNYVQEGSSAKLDQGSISFGDLNNDGLDDAAAIVTRPAPGDATESVLAMFINQNNIMFNIADLSLGTAPVTIYSHHVVSGGLLTIDMQAAGGMRATTTYQLLGNQILKVLL